MATLHSIVAHDYRRFDPAHKADFGDQVISALTINAPLFPALPKTVAQLTTINNLLRTKNTAAAGGSSAAIKDRDQYITDIWTPAFDLDASYVESIALGNALIIVESGYHATKDATTAHSIPVQMKVEVKPGGAKEVTWESKTGVDAHAFTLIGIKVGEGNITQFDDHFEVETTVPSKIIVVTSTTKKGSIKGLTRKDEIDFYMVGENAIGTSPVSEKSNVLVP